jgi:hypothetical protein
MPEIVVMHSAEILRAPKSRRSLPSRARSGGHRHFRHDQAGGYPPCRGPLTTLVPGSSRHQTQGGLPAHPRIHLFVRRRLSEGRHLRLFDHADIQYGMFSSLPRRPVAQVRQTGYPTGARWRPQPPQQPTRGSDNVSLFFLPPYAPELNPKESLWDEIREKYSRTTPSNPLTPCTTS